MSLCDTQDCNNGAEMIDEYSNVYCIWCAAREIEETDLTVGDFELIDGVIKHDDEL